MKIKRFIITGLILSLLGGGIAVCASLRKDFELRKALNDPTLEEKRMDLKHLTSIEYHGQADDILIQKAETDSMTYYEGTHCSYQIEYNEALGKLVVEQQWEPQFILQANGINPLVITVSEELLLNLELHLNVGKITVKDLNILDLSCSVNAGDIEVKDTTIAAMEGSVNTGDIRYSGLLLKSCNLAVDVGYIELKLENHEMLCSINNHEDGLIWIDYKIHVGTAAITFKEEGHN